MFRLASISLQDAEVDKKEKTTSKKQFLSKKEILPEQPDSPPAESREYRPCFLFDLVHAMDILKYAVNTQKDDNNCASTNTSTYTNTNTSTSTTTSTVDLGYISSMKKLQLKSRRN